MQLECVINDVRQTVSFASLTWILTCPVDLQVALHELSKALPEDLRPLPAHLVEVADNNTSALPNTGVDAGLYPIMGRHHE